MMVPSYMPNTRHTSQITQFVLDLGNQNKKVVTTPHTLKSSEVMISQTAMSEEVKRI
jgi:hypothetical protein